MRTIFGIAILVAGASLGGSWYMRANLQQAPQFRTLAVERGELLIAVSATGTVEPVEIIDVGAQIVGRIQQFGPDPREPGKTIDYGTQVQQDDVLAQLDDSPQLAELEKAQANLKLAEAELQRYEAQMKQAEQDYARAERLREANATADYDHSLALYEMARADIRIGEAKLLQAQIAKKQADINLSYTTIKSPIDGVIIDRRVNVGQTVVAGLNAPSLFLLAKDLSRMQVWSAVNEADIGDIHVGQKATFRVDAYRDQTFTGQVSQIRLNASMSNNVVTYGVVVDIDNTDSTLMPYMTANIQFEVDRRSDALLVPNQALRWRPLWQQITPAARAGIAPPPAEPGEDGKEQPVGMATPTVWVLADDGLVRPIPVQVGLSDGMVSEVVEGDLQPQMLVVVSTIRKREQDFVSSFIDKVTKSDDDKQDDK